MHLYAIPIVPAAVRYAICSKILKIGASSVISDRFSKTLLLVAIFLTRIKVSRLYLNFASSLARENCE